MRPVVPVYHPRREARRAVKQGYPRRLGNVRLCRSGEGVERLLQRHLVDAVVLDVKAAPDLALHGPIRVIDWYFRFRGKTIHKFCHFFLFESSVGEPAPQVEEGITACVWQDYDTALEKISYDNARGVLKRAAEMVRVLDQAGDAEARG